MTEPSYRKLLWSLALVGLVLDLTTKYVVFHHGHTVAMERPGDFVSAGSASTPFQWGYRDGHAECPVIPGVFELLAQFERTRAGEAQSLGSLRTWGGETPPRVNHGALFGWDGILFGMRVFPPEYSNTGFAVISLLAAAAIIYWSTQQTLARDWSLCAALGLILAGTLGNLYDRIVFDGVRDFIHWHWYDSFDWPVFNIADCCLVMGAGILLAQAIFQRSPADQPGTEQAAAIPAVAK